MAGGEAASMAAARLALSGLQMSRVTGEVNLIVGGQKFTMQREQIMRYPTALLAELLTAQILGAPGQGPLFVDRHPRAFEGVHKFYASNGKRLEKPWKVAKE